METRDAGTNQVLQLAGPQRIVLVERMLVRNGLQAEDLLLLSNDLNGSIVKDRLDC